MDNEGRSSGVSIPVASIDGHAVRYHVGATRGHYVQAPVATAIDQGRCSCAFAKLIGYQHSPDGSTQSPAGPAPNA